MFKKTEAIYKKKLKFFAKNTLIWATFSNREKKLHFEGSRKKMYGWIVKDLLSFDQFL